MADEKQEEKFNEKEMEKREEKSAEEKSWEEKWQRDPVGSVVWALILIWAGLVLLADNLGYLDQLRIQDLDTPRFIMIAGMGAWSLILMGAGAIVGLGILVRLMRPEYRRPLGGDIFLAVLLFGIGLSNLTGWEIVWPLILIGLGLSFIMRGFLRRS